MSDFKFTKREAGVICAVTISSILPLLDGSIINVIMPALSVFFQQKTNDIQWVVTAYFLFSLAGLLLSSHLQRKFGVKRIWISSSIVFLIGSVLSGWSNDFSEIILSRMLQGIGAGLLLPLSQTIIATEFGKERMRAAMGVVAVPAVFAPAVGPLCGALLTEYLSWRVVFFINIPAIAISLWIGFKCLNESAVEKTIRLNVRLFLIFTLSVCLFFYSIDKMKGSMSAGWFILLILSLLMFLFGIKYNSIAKSKIIDFCGFKKRNYAISMIMNVIVSFLFYGFMIFFPLENINYNASPAGLVTVGVLLGMQGIGAWLGRKLLYPLLSDKTPFFIMSLGIFISCLSVMLFGFNVGLNGLGFFIRGIGLGISTIACLTAPMLWVEREFINDTSVITRLLQQIGGVFGGIYTGVMIYLLSTGVVTHSGSYVIFFMISAMFFFISLLFLRLSEK